MINCILYKKHSWKMKPCKMTLKHAFDGLVYALLTAGIFGWLWP